MKKLMEKMDTFFCRLEELDKKLDTFLLGLISNLLEFISNPTIKNQIILSILFVSIASPLIWWLCMSDFIHKLAQRF
ncbi:MAG: hypothetical protein H8E17_12605 [Deltaproteobacteria bacterium]|nr:hypothetical protein [Deltaproteobacteria bacterium]